MSKENPASEQSVQDIYRGIGEFMIELESFRDTYRAYRTVTQQVWPVHPSQPETPAGPQRRSYLGSHHTHFAPLFQQISDRNFELEMLAGVKTVNELIISVDGIHHQVVVGGVTRDLTITGWHGAGKQPGIHSWSLADMPGRQDLPYAPILARLLGEPTITQ